MRKREHKGGRREECGGRSVENRTHRDEDVDLQDVPTVKVQKVLVDVRHVSLHDAEHHFRLPSSLPEAARRCWPADRGGKEGEEGEGEEEGEERGRGRIERKEERKKRSVLCFVISSHLTTSSLAVSFFCCSPSQHNTTPHATPSPQHSRTSRGESQSRRDPKQDTKQEQDKDDTRGCCCC